MEGEVSRTSSDIEISSLITPKILFPFKICTELKAQREHWFKKQKQAFPGSIYNEHIKRDQLPLCIKLHQEIQSSGCYKEMMFHASKISK